MASYFAFDSDQNQVLFEAQSNVRKISLNRPQHLNSLTYEMVSEITRALKEYENDPQVRLVIVKGKGKAFCAGGDVIRVINSIVTGHWSFAASFYKKQLTLDHMIATYKKPLVCIINGIVMGGGAGLSMHARFRVVTENAVFAMPEALIGYFPDVGASYFLSRLPGYFGEYLGLTSARINGTEMLACGLATHLVLSKDILLLENALHEVASSDSRTIFDLINKFTSKGGLDQDILNKRLEVINKCFSKETVEEILSSLDNEVANGADKWVLKALDAMKLASPTSLKIFLRCIREGRKQKLEYCLTQECTVGMQIARRTAGNDFFEGARATFFEKDKRPKWKPSQLKEVTQEMIDKVFTRPDDEDWVDFQLPNKRHFHDTAKSKL